MGWESGLVLYLLHGSDAVKSLLRPAGSGLPVPAYAETVLLSNWI